MLKSVNHAGIVKVKELIQINKDGHNYMIMDLVKGPSLRNWLKTQRKSKGFSEDQALRIIYSILKTVTYLHNEAHICHRDIKPANIIVREECLFDQKELKICTVLVDFGVAFKLDEEKSKKGDFEMLTPTGTPDYKAPEMFSGEIFSEKVDIWAIGITLLEIFKGNRLIKSDSDIPLSFISSGVKGLIEQMLNRNPTKRISAFDALYDSCFKELKNVDVSIEELKSIDSWDSEFETEEENKISANAENGNSKRNSIESKHSSPNKNSLIKLLKNDLFFKASEDRVYDSSLGKSQLIKDFKKKKGSL